MSEKLQMDPKLDLQKAINTMHQSEAVKMQQAAIRGRAITTDKAIDALHKTRHLQKGQGYKVPCKQSYSNKPPVNRAVSKAGSAAALRVRALLSMRSITDTFPTAVSSERRYLSPLFQERTL